MNNINDKTKKRLIIFGGLAVSIVLIILIAAQFKKEPVKEVSVPPPSAAQVSTATVTPAEASKTQKDIVVQDSKVAEATKSTIQEPNTAISSGTKQTIQPDPVKPTAPTEKPKSTDKTSNTDEKPTVTGKPKTTVKDSTISKTEPKGGEKKDGEIYVPGFGWVKDNGGGTEVKPVDDMYENGNKIGEMN